MLASPCHTSQGPRRLRPTVRVCWPWANMATQSYRLVTAKPSPWHDCIDSHTDCLACLLTKIILMTFTSISLSYSAVMCPSMVPASLSVPSLPFPTFRVLKLLLRPMPSDDTPTTPATQPTKSTSHQPLPSPVPLHHASPTRLLPHQCPLMVLTTGEHRSLHRLRSRFRTRQPRLRCLAQPRCRDSS